MLYRIGDFMHKKMFFGDQKLEIILQLIHFSNYYFGYIMKLEIEKSPNVSMWFSSILIKRESYIY